MKARFLLLLFLAGTAWATSTVRWVNPSGAHWLELYGRGTHVQIGLREDGVVVWREISTVTNSPSERPIEPPVPPPITNIFLYPTNIIRVWTNATVPVPWPLDLPPSGAANRP